MTNRSTQEGDNSRHFSVLKSPAPRVYARPYDPDHRELYGVGIICVADVLLTSGYRRMDPFL